MSTVLGDFSNKWGYSVVVESRYNKLLEAVDGFGYKDFDEESKSIVDDIAKKALSIASDKFLPLKGGSFTKFAMKQRLKSIANEGWNVGKAGVAGHTKADISKMLSSSKILPEGKGIAVRYQIPAELIARLSSRDERVTKAGFEGRKEHYYDVKYDRYRTSYIWTRNMFGAYGGLKKWAMAKLGQDERESGKTAAKIVYSWVKSPAGRCKIMSQDAFRLTRNEEASKAFKREFSDRFAKVSVDSFKKHIKNKING